MKHFSLLAVLLCLASSATYADSIDLKSQIIAEPEAANTEQAQTCAAAGPGFKYVPGTQTCIRVSGYVRYEVNIGGK